MKSTLALLFCLLLVLTGCEDKNKRAASLKIEASAFVENLGSFKVPGASVYLNGIKQEGLTDLNGILIVENLEPGIYEVMISNNNYGEARKAVDLRIDLQQEVSVVLYPTGSDPFILDIDNSLFKTYCEGEPLKFSMKLNSVYIPVEQLDVRVSLYQDHVPELILFEGKAAGDGKIEFEGMIPCGGYNLIVRVMSETKEVYRYVVYTEFNKPMKIGNFRAVKQPDQTVKMTWDRFGGDRFSGYFIYVLVDDSPKKNYIYWSYNLSDVEFTDQCPLFGDSLQYVMEVRNIYMNNTITYSEKLHMGDQLMSREKLTIRAAHPELSLVYYQNKGELTAYDYEKKKVTGRVSKPQACSDIRFEQRDGTNDVLLSFQDGKICRYDANLKYKSTEQYPGAISSFIQLNSDLRLCSFADPMFYNGLCVFNNQKEDVWRKDIAAGNSIERIPGSDKLILSKPEVRDVYLASYTQEGEVKVLDKALIPNIGILISPCGRYLIDGAYKKVYAIADNKLELKGNLPLYLMYKNYLNMAFSENGDEMYIPMEMESRTIAVVSYPELKQVRTIRTRGDVVSVMRTGSDLICVSKIDQFQSQNNYYIERVRVDK